MRRISCCLDLRIIELLSGYLFGSLDSEKQGSVWKMFES